MKPIKALNLSDHSTARSLLELQRIAYQIEADIIGNNQIPPLHETLSELQSCGETFYGYFVEDALAGALAYKLIGPTLDIHRLMVHPNFFRQGIARKLIEHVELLHPEAERAIVQTGSLNQPAVKLYQQLGYRIVDTKEVSPNLLITRFEKRLHL